MNALLDVHDLHVDLSGSRVLQSLSFSLPRCRLVGLIGPNGAGKTTLLETLAGLVPIRAGDVRFAGEPLEGSGRYDRLFYLPDGILPFPDQRAGEVLERLACAHGESAARVEELEKALGLAPLLSKRVGRLSKGGRKRLLLALALLAPQPLLLLDEPVDGLDLHQVKALRATLESVRDSGRTLLLSIHEIALAGRVCEEFILLADGRLLAAGDLESLRARAGLAAGGLDDVFLALT